MKKLLLLMGFLFYVYLIFLCLVPKEANNEIISPIPEVTERPSPTPASTPEHSPSYYYGQASWYGAEYCDNKPCRTASGDWFDENAFTAACDYNIPLGSKLIASVEGNSIEVVCNDRGSFAKRCGRILDLSKAAFKALAPNSKGVIWVRVKVVE